jgi:hypothetical protein
MTGKMTIKTNQNMSLTAMMRMSAESIGTRDKNKTAS